MVARAFNIPELPASSVSDRTLVERCLDGDRQSFRLLYARHCAGLARLLHNLGAQAGDLDDIIQDTFVIAHRSLPQLRDPDHVRSWLMKIAVRELRRLMSRRNFHRRMTALWAQFVPTSSDPAASAAADELSTILDAVPPKLRIPWVLQRVGGYSIVDVAEACSASPATIKRRLSEADARIERRLGREDE